VHGRCALLLALRHEGCILLLLVQVHAGCNLLLSVLGYQGQQIQPGAVLAHVQSSAVHLLAPVHASLAVLLLAHAHAGCTVLLLAHVHGSLVLQLLHTQQHNQTCRQDNTQAATTHPQTTV
jgi:hypothetical protein